MKLIYRTETFDKHVYCTVGLRVGPWLFGWYTRNGELSCAGFWLHSLT